MPTALHHHHRFTFGLKAPTDAAEVAPMVEALAERGHLPISIPTCPMMHGTGMWIGSMMPLLGGGRLERLAVLTEQIAPQAVA